MDRSGSQSGQSHMVTTRVTGGLPPSVSITGWQPALQSGGGAGVDLGGLNGAISKPAWEYCPGQWSQARMAADSRAGWS